MKEKNRFVQTLIPHIFNVIGVLPLALPLAQTQTFANAASGFCLQFSLQFRHLSQTVCKEISFQCQSITTKPVCSFVCRNANFETNSEK